MKFHLAVSTLLNTSLKQVNISPTLSNFIAAVNLAREFQMYRIKKVSYKFLPLVSVSLPAQIPLAYYYVVRDPNGIFPQPTEVDYLSFSGCRF